MDTYTIYANWCRAHGYAAPSREQWERWCRAPRRVQPNCGVVEDQREIDRERREGWAYD